MKNRTVTIRQFEAIISPLQERKFLRELEVWMESDRPRVVLDCTQLREVNEASIRMMLCCLEEAMKRNGDVKLAGLPDGASAIMEETDANRVLAAYATVADAVNSFNDFAAAQPASPRAHDDASTDK